MIKTISIAVPLLLFCHVSAASPDIAEQGRELHEKHCQGCHKSEVYARSDRKVQNAAQLVDRIKFCEGANNMQWSDRQVKMVDAYLNKAYYKFSD
ncbi:MAG: hypothetical protein AB1810_14470 [Pseudomonadota bacterium]